MLNTLRLSAIVFVSNILGALLFALLAVKTPALSVPIRQQLVQLGMLAIQGSNAHVFWSAVLGGWIIALMAWIVSASHWTIGQVTVIWLLTAIVGLGRFAHCIASTGEILSAVLAGQTAYTNYLVWIVFAALGNIAGGITFVTLLNFAQVKAAMDEDSSHQHSIIDRAA